MQLARDGASALLLLKTRGAPSVTITELSLPQVDGFSLLAELRKIASAAESPAVVISAFRELRDTAFKLKDSLGISSLLARGAPAESIRRAVKKALSRTSTPGPAKAERIPPRELRSLGEPDPEKVEEQRLARLDAKKLVDDLPPEEVLQEIVRKAALQFKVPVALITLVLKDRQFFKAHHGLGGKLLEDREVPLDQSFCRHVVQGRQPLIVPDAALHPFFSKSPLVLDGTLRSYAGAPLETPGGEILGSLCIIDTKPMAISAEDVDQLVMLARLVAGELELLSETRRQEAERARLGPALRDRTDLDQSLGTALSYLSAVMDNIDNGVCLLDEARTVVLANPALCEMFGIAPEKMIGMKREELNHEISQLFSDPEDFLSKLRTAPIGPYALRGDFEMVKPRRRVIRLISKPVRLGKGVGQMGVITDITAELDLLAEREQLARTDPITGLANRRSGEESLEREASRGQRFGARVSIALFDIDHFKQINDRFGHPAGDEVLRGVASVLNDAMRGADIAVRWGGDELLVVLPNTGIDGARSFGERVRAGVEALDGDIFRGVTLSCGLAELDPGEEPSEALERADAMLYEAKDQGRNRVV